MANFRIYLRRFCIVVFVLLLFYKLWGLRKEELTNKQYMSTLTQVLANTYNLNYTVDYVGEQLDGTFIVERAYVQYSPTGEYLVSMYNPQTYNEVKAYAEKVSNNLKNFNRVIDDVYINNTLPEEQRIVYSSKGYKALYQDITGALSLDDVTNYNCLDQLCLTLPTEIANWKFKYTVGGNYKYSGTYTRNGFSYFADLEVSPVDSCVVTFKLQNVNQAFYTNVNFKYGNSDETFETTPLFKIKLAESNVLYNIKTHTDSSCNITPMSI